MKHQLKAKEDEKSYPEIALNIVAWVFLVVITILFCVGAYRLVFPPSQATPQTQGQMPQGDWSRGAAAPKETLVGTCDHVKLFNGTLEVYTVEKFDDETRGYTSNGKIVISKQGNLPLINIASHEASHAVDRIVGRTGANDEETRAYLQGYITECVYNLVEKS